MLKSRSILLLLLLYLSGFASTLLINVPADSAKNDNLGVLDFSKMVSGVTCDEIEGSYGIFYLRRSSKSRTSGTPSWGKASRTYNSSNAEKKFLIPEGEYQLSFSYYRSVETTTYDTVGVIVHKSTNSKTSSSGTVPVNAKVVAGKKLIFYSPFKRLSTGKQMFTIVSKDTSCSINSINITRKRYIDKVCECESLDDETEYYECLERQTIAKFIEPNQPKYIPNIKYKGILGASIGTLAASGVTTIIGIGSQSQKGEEQTFTGPNGDLQHGVHGGGMHVLIPAIGVDILGTLGLIRGIKRKKEYDAEKKRLMAKYKADLDILDAEKEKELKKIRKVLKNL